MTIARTLARRLVAAGFAVASLAFAQEPAETPAAAPKVAPEAAPEPAAPEREPPAPARSVLWPDFQVGQHAVLEMMFLDTSMSTKPILATIDVEVIDKTDDVFTIRWTPNNARVPSDFNGGRMVQFLCIMNGTAGPPLEIQIQEDAGYLGLRNWKEASERALADMRESILSIGRGTANAIPADQVDQMIAPLRTSLFATQDAADSALYRNASGFFDGAYAQITPGQTLSTAMEVPWPFGDAKEGLMLPMTRTLSLATVATEPALVYELLIHQEHDAERMKDLMESFAQNLPEDMRGDEVNRITNSEIELKTRWRFDAAKGWPVRASSTVRLTSAAHVITRSMTYTLVEGPTMKAVENSPDATPLQPDPAQQKSPPASAEPSSK